jgi:hypothetical protein
MGTTKTELTSENLPDFLRYYHGLHDAAVKNITYNVMKETAALELEIFWAGEQRLEDDAINYAGTKKKNLTLFFDGVIRFNFTERDRVDYILDVFFKHITENFVEGTFWDNKPVFVFAIGDEFDCERNVFGGISKPSRANFIVCEKVSYSTE